MGFKREDSVPQSRVTVWEMASKECLHSKVKIMSINVIARTNGLVREKDEQWIMCSSEPPREETPLMGNACLVLLVACCLPPELQLQNWSPNWESRVADKGCQWDMRELNPRYPLSCEEIYTPYLLSQGSSFYPLQEKMEKRTSPPLVTITSESL